jgi:hypothetical protein
MSLNAWAKALGEYGATFIASTTRFNGNWSALQCIVPTKFSTLDGNFTGDVSSFINDTQASAYEFPAGFVIFGDIRAIDLHYGKVVAYKSTFN